MSNRPSLFRNILTVTLGMLVGLSLSSLVFNSGSPLSILVCGWIELSILGIVLVKFTDRRVIQPGLEQYSKRARLQWVGLCLLGGFILLSAIPWTAYPKGNIVRITASGEKNPAAQGSEVWLAGISSEIQDFSWRMDRLCSGDWQLSTGRLVSSEDQPSELVCHVQAEEQINLKFGMHPWSGIVLVNFGNRQIVQDLFSAGGSQFETTFPVTLTPAERILDALLLLANGITLASLLLVASLWAINRPARWISARVRKPIPWFGYAIPLMAGWFIYLLAYWPGFLSPDVVDQLRQVGEGRLNNWHPAFHTLTIWLITRLWFVPASVAIFQILILGGLLGWGFSYLERRNTPRPVIWLSVAFLALSPAIGLLINTLWKDVAYSIAMVALVLLILQIVDSSGAWLEGKMNLLALGLATALTSLFRLNGAATAIPAVAALIISYPKRWRAILAALVIGVGSWLLVIGPLYQTLNVETENIRPEALGQNLGMTGAAYGMIAWHIQAGTPLNAGERELLNQIITPDGAWVDFLTVSRYASQLQDLAVRLSLRNPLAALGFFQQKSSFIFQVLQPPGVRTEFVSRTLYENPFGFVATSRLPFLEPLFERIASWSELPTWNWLFWRNAFWMFLLIFGTIVAWARTRNWRYCLVIFPVVLNALPLALLSGGHLARYIMPTLLLGPFLSSYFWFSPRMNLSDEDK